MTTIPELPAASEQGADVAHADGVLAGRVMSSAVFLAGLIANGLLKTVGRPDKLPRDLWPHVPPEVAEEIFNRGVAVGFHAGRRDSAARLHRDEFDRVQAQYEEAGYAAMGRAVSRSRRLVAPHPADGEMARPVGSGVTSSTTDTSWEAGDR